MKIWSDPLTGTAEQHPACELCSSVWADQIHWPEWLYIHPVCESLSSVWAYQIHWSIQLVSCSPVFEQIRSTSTWVAKHPSSLWVTLQCLSRSDPLTWMAEHPYRLWVALKCLSRSIHWPERLDTHLASWSDPLIRMAEHMGPSSLWVTL